jgi:micrococcal nuclease
VRLERDVEARDDYGRLLAYVHRADDGLFVNLELVERGYAQPMTIPPNVANAERFVAAAREAEAADRGLWSSCGG